MNIPKTKIIDGVEWKLHKGEWISVEYQRAPGGVTTRVRPINHPEMLTRWQRFKYWLFRGAPPKPQERIEREPPFEKRPDVSEGR